MIAYLLSILFYVIIGIVLFFIAFLVVIPYYKRYQMTKQQGVVALGSFVPLAGDVYYMN